MNDIICFEVVNASSSGVTLNTQKGNIFISFDECTKNYVNENLLIKSNCVATRDITTLTFTFYTNPKTRVIFKKNIFKALLSGKTTTSEFFNLQKTINQCGYTSLDMS